MSYLIFLNICFNIEIINSQVDRDREKFFKMGGNIKLIEVMKGFNEMTYIIYVVYGEQVFGQWWALLSFSYFFQIG